jgi:hypothetical protein
VTISALGVWASSCSDGGTTSPTPVISPTVNSVIPSSGSTAGGTVVTITGSNFSVGPTVTIGGVAATNIRVTGTTTIVATTGAHAAGTVDVLVVVGGKAGSLSSGFVYTPPVVNTPPVISAIAAQGTRVNEPASFADLGETIVLAATVTDAETSPDRLTFAWSAPLGTFTGTGATVQWTAPTGVAVPTNVVITLTVTEPLSSVAETSGPAVSQSVSATTTVRVHDSANEGAALGRLFLLEFSDSRLTDADDILRNFWDGCAGYEIGPTASTTIAFGGAWNVNGWHEHGDGYMTIPCRWDDMLKDGSGAGTSSGMCSLWSVYRESRWWLCSSHYLGTRTTASGVTTIEVR